MTGLQQHWRSQTQWVQGVGGHATWQCWVTVLWCVIMVMVTTLWFSMATAAPPLSGWYLTLGDWTMLLVSLSALTVTGVHCDRLYPWVKYHVYYRQQWRTPSQCKPRPWQWPTGLCCGQQTTMGWVWEWWHCLHVITVTTRIAPYTNSLDIWLVVRICINVLLCSGYTLDYFILCYFTSPGDMLIAVLC